MVVGGGADRLQASLSSRLVVLFGALCLLFLVLFVRLWDLQINRQSEFASMADSNRLRTVYTQPTRGRIFDRFRRVLADNRPAFNIELVLEDSPNPEQTVRRLAEIVGESPDPLLERLKASRKRRPFEPRLLLRDVSRDTVAKVSAHRFELPGVTVEVVPARSYLHGATATHVLGYIREASQTQLDKYQELALRSGELVGQFGLEEQFETTLHGRSGKERFVVTATGNRIAEFSAEQPEPGKDLTTTLDLDVQLAADRALAGQKGAVVALDPRTGEVLALASGPTFDPNNFSREFSPEDWKSLSDPTQRPLENRAIQGRYPPGSTFKFILSAAGLQEKVVGEHESIHCPGYLPFGGRRFHCHKRDGHQAVDARSALVMSCDVFYYTVGQRLGIEKIADYASRFGLGRKTGIELAGENAGLVPSPDWKAKYFKKTPANQMWFPGETLSVAIGQGATVTTPLQIAVALSTLVNGGQLLRPRLVQQVEGAPPTTVEVVGNVGISKRILEEVTEHMVGVVNDKRGTGHAAKLERFPDIVVGGKTGTSQVMSLDKRDTSLERHRHHAWFIGFAPAEAPEIVVAALIEHGESGGKAAAPVVAAVMDGYFAARRGVPTLDATPAAQPLPVP